MVVSDQQAQTGERIPRVSTTTLMIAIVLLLLILAGAAIAAWVITRQPPERPLQVPSVSRAHILF